MKTKRVKWVIIPKTEYDELVERSDWLAYLEAAGVDNWSGYSNAMDMKESDSHES
jgi:hypothetical protein